MGVVGTSKFVTELFLVKQLCVKTCYGVTSGHPYKRFAILNCFNRLDLKCTLGINSRFPRLR